MNFLHCAALRIGCYFSGQMPRRLQICRAVLTGRAGAWMLPSPAVRDWRGEP